MPRRIKSKLSPVGGGGGGGGRAKDRSAGLTHQASLTEAHPKEKCLLKANAIPAHACCSGMRRRWRRQAGPSEGLGRHSPRQGAERVRLPGGDRWRADTPDCTWSRNVEDDRSTCGLEPSPVSSGRTMTGMCVQSIATPASPNPLSASFQSTKKAESEMQSDKLNAE